VHSIGPDVVVFEVQQNSDVTYRLYDWGRPRELHVQKALAVARVDAGRSANGARPVVKPQRLPDGGVQLIATPYFRVVRHELAGARELATDGTFKIVTAIAGAGTLAFGAGRSAGRLRLHAGDTALVPACIERFELQPARRLTAFVTGPGER
jgi:mannose-6-phosphate isomerase